MVLGYVPQLGQIGRALRCRVTPLAGAAPRDLQHHTVLLIFLHLVWAILFVVACSLLSSFLIICLETPLLPGEPVQLSLCSFPWGLGHGGKHALRVLGCCTSDAGGVPPSGQPIVGSLSSVPTEGLTLRFL